MEDLDYIFIKSNEFKFKYIYEKIFKIIIYEEDPLIINLKDLTKSNYKDKIDGCKLRLDEVLNEKEYIDKLNAFELTLNLFKEPKNFNININSIDTENINKKIKYYFIAKNNDDIEDYINYKSNNEKFSKILIRSNDVFFRENFSKKITSINFNYFKSLILFLNKLLYENYKMKIFDIQKINGRFCFSVIYNNYISIDDMPRNLKERILLQLTEDEYINYRKDNPNELLSLIKFGSLVPKINFDEKISIFENNIFNGDDLIYKLQELFEYNNVDKEIFKKFCKIVDNSNNKNGYIDQIKSAVESNNKEFKNEFFLDLINRIIKNDEKIDLNDTNTFFFIMELVNGLVEINSPNRNVYIVSNDKFDNKLIKQEKSKDNTVIDFVSKDN